MKRVHIIHDPYKLDESTVADVENPLEYLKSEFKGGFPEHAKIYKGSIAIENDITEKLQKDELLINLIDEDIWVVIWPSWIQFVFYAVVALTAALSVYMYLTMPNMRAVQEGSANNGLSARVNRVRFNARVPDIFGTIRAVPDLVSQPRTYYENDIEIEECLMCLGVGYYDILDVKDDMTLVSGINGASVSVYQPNTSIVGTPYEQVGLSILEQPKFITKSSSINGQTLEAPNDMTVDEQNLYFTSGGVIRSRGIGDFTTVLSTGDNIEIFGAMLGVDDRSYSGLAVIGVHAGNYFIEFEFTQDILGYEDYKGIRLTGATYEIVTEIDNDGVITTESTFRDVSGSYAVSEITRTSGYTYRVNIIDAQLVNYNWSYVSSNHTVSTGLILSENLRSMNLNGRYTISSTSTHSITLESPDIVNNDWLKIDSIFGGSTENITTSITIDKLTTKWVGWFDIYDSDADEIVFNLFFPQGLYGVNSKGKKHALQIKVYIEYQNIDENGSPIGSIQRSTIHFDINKPKPFGRTYTYILPNKGSARFRISKVDWDAPWSNNITEAKIKEVYLSSNVESLVYNDVTMVRSRTLATEGALSLKERKLNMLVQRKLPLNGTGALVATNSAAQALICLALDQKNGRRSTSEVDIAQILAEEQAVINYFGNSKAAEFSYTIDDNNLSFEEIAGMVASTMFCEAYRYGNKLRIRFEQPQQNSILLFNAANKAPNSEKRTKSFGIEKKYDGIEIEYTSPDDDTRITYVASDVGNPINTMQIKTSGIRSHEQAKTRAWREWNKLKYRNINCEFEALEESELLARNDRILVADNTVVKTKDGIIDFVDGLTLSLSHPIESDVTYFIYLQLADGRVDIVPCSYVDEYTVLLSRPPLIALVPEFTTYQLIESTEAPHNAFIVTEIRPQGKMTNMLTCVNYDERYYQNDADFF